MNTPHSPYDIRDDDLQEDSQESAPVASSYETCLSVDEYEVPELSEYLQKPSTSPDALRSPASFLDKINHGIQKISHTPAVQNIQTTLSNIQHFFLENESRSKIESMFIESNSPISSGHNSDTEDAVAPPPSDLPFRILHEQVNNVFEHKHVHYKKITYEEIEQSLSKYYDKNNKFSNEMDILITYMRGQKVLYKNACHVTQHKLYAITFTALCITSMLTVITPFIQEFVWRIILISGGNAVATALITVLNYLRYESACNSYTLMSNHYEQLEHSLEFTNNKLLFMNDEPEQNKIVLDKIREVEFKLSETKELCPLLVPEEVQHSFPVMYHTNIFSLMNKLDMHRKSLILQFKDVKNEIRYILYKWNTLSPPYENTPQRQREKTRLLFLMELKEKIKKELVEYKHAYNQVDDLFLKEIKYAEWNRQCFHFFSCRPKKIQYDSYSNPVIREHLDILFD